jgi:hypothetical membrane protein
MSENAVNFMNRKTEIWVKLSGIMGIVGPIIAFACILLSISSYQRFSWTDNALSDLGVRDGITAALFNYGLIVSGVSALVFDAGLFKLLHEEKTGRIGALLFGSATIALTLIGIFPENTKQTHHYVSVAFFVLFPIAMLTITASFVHARKMKMGLFTLAVAMSAAAPWIVQFIAPYVSNVAIPETISALAAAAWSMALGSIILNQVAQQRG